MYFDKRLLMQNCVGDDKIRFWQSWISWRLLLSILTRPCLLKAIHVTWPDAIILLESLRKRTFSKLSVLMISSHKSFRQDLYTFAHSKNCRNLSTEWQKTSSKIFCLLIFFVIYKNVLVFDSRICVVDKIYKGIICNI